MMCSLGKNPSISRRPASLPHHQVFSASPANVAIHLPSQLHFAYTFSILSAVYFERGLRLFKLYAYQFMDEDRSWMYRRTVPGLWGLSTEFKLGVKRFVNWYLKEDDLKLHLHKSWFLLDYYNWTAHGELLSGYRPIVGKIALQEMLKVTLTVRVHCGSGNDEKETKTDKNGAKTTITEAISKNAALPREAYVIFVFCLSFIKVYPPFVSCFYCFWEDPEKNKELFVYKVRGAKGEHGTPSYRDRLAYADEQLMFDAANGSDNGHVYHFRSQSAAITAELWGGSNSDVFNMKRDMILIIRMQDK
ncbi:hypothetical protein M9H77_29510 [Catharanthus roseus]|uniref:Uncharacterized protein n=1 Tax=Catharanthus roseus TaxID=4058 RepID=A0ACB9ZWU0_CATRO|nr:hypothetical protein M9H77_29510 [Catharanthus roseus]